MKKDKEFDYYEEMKGWDFERFEIETEKLTNFDLFVTLNNVANKNSRILDLGTGGAEKLLKYFPDCLEILGTDYSPAMIATAKRNLELSGRKNISFKLMDNLKMDVPKDYFDIVVARNTVTDPQQIYQVLKKGGYLLIGGVDKDDCYSLKYLYNGEENYNDSKPISITDYENVLKAGFRDVELIPIHEREYFKNAKLFKEFLMKVPILSNFGDISEQQIDYEKLDKYIAENTYNGKIRLLRRYYGITARK